ncbi:MAG: dihydroneopterin aldolase [Rikenellaceae bacterium]|jgi:dihydroneopterin aldolase|nr:dihydroneopterin aldolase [Rikenellaceae bacterium]
MRTTILLEQLEFYAHHGCYDLERRVGMRFVVDLRIEAETGDAALRDDLDGTVNYQTVYEIVRGEMELPSRTIENAALRIADAVRAKFPTVISVEVRLSKIAPALGGKAGRATVVISR